MPTVPKIPGHVAVKTFQRIEAQLSKFLEYVPYCHAHKGVWSDALSGILLDSCTLLDSLWRARSKKSSYVKKLRENLNMLDYFKFFGGDMVPRWLVFWGEESVKVTPFAGWSKTGRFAGKNDFQTPGWWKAYTNVKHDRLLNREDATLEVVVRAVGALLLAILSEEDCREPATRAGWLAHRPEMVAAHLCEDSISCKKQWITVETRLFTYAVGWGREPILKRQKWAVPQYSSARFMEWYDAYGDKV